MTLGCQPCRLYEETFLPSKDLKAHILRGFSSCLTCQHGHLHRDDFVPRKESEVHIKGLSELLNVA